MERIQLRRDASARWAEINPILLEGEVGFEIDTKLRKIGDGVNRWNDLEYLRAEGIVQETGNSENVVMSQAAVSRELSKLGSEVALEIGNINYDIKGQGKLAEKVFNIESGKELSRYSTIFHVDIQSGSLFTVSADATVQGFLYIGKEMFVSDGDEFLVSVNDANGKSLEYRAKYDIKSISVYVSADNQGGKIKLLVSSVNESGGINKKIEDLNNKDADNFNYLLSNTQALEGLHINRELNSAEKLFERSFKAIEYCNPNTNSPAYLVQFGSYETRAQVTLNIDGQNVDFVSTNVPEMVGVVEYDFVNGDAYIRIVFDWSVGHGNTYTFQQPYAFSLTNGVTIKSVKNIVTPLSESIKSTKAMVEKNISDISELKEDIKQIGDIQTGEGLGTLITKVNEASKKTYEYYRKISNTPIYESGCIVSFIDDDTGQYVPNIWGDIIGQTNIRMGFACITGIMEGEVGLPYEGSRPMTFEQLQDLYDNGHDIYSHSWSHKGEFSTDVFTEEDIYDECIKSREWLESKGFTRASDIIVYPGSLTQNMVTKKDMVRKVYAYGVDTVGRTVNPEPLDNWCIYRCNADTMPLSEMKEQVENAIKKRGLLVFMTHAYELMAVEGTTSTHNNRDLNVKKIVDIIKYIQERNVPIMPLSEALQCKGNVIASGEYTHDGSLFVSYSGKVKNNLNNLLFEGDIVDLSEYLPNGISSYDSYGGTYYYIKNNMVHIHFGLSGLVPNAVNLLFPLSSVDSNLIPLKQVIGIGTCGTSYTQTSNVTIKEDGSISVCSYDNYCNIDVCYPTRG